MNYTVDHYLKLETYSPFFYDFFIWRHATSYYRLCVSFTNFSLNAQEFCDQFFLLRSMHVPACNKLLSELSKSLNPQQLLEFPIDSKAFGFGEIIDSIDEKCCNFIDVQHVDENQLRIHIEEAVSIIQEK